MFKIEKIKYDSLLLDFNRSLLKDIGMELKILVEDTYGSKNDKPIKPTNLGCHSYEDDDDCFINTCHAMLGVLIGVIITTIIFTILV